MVLQKSQFFMKPSTVYCDLSEIKFPLGTVVATVAARIVDFHEQVIKNKLYIYRYTYIFGCSCPQAYWYMTEMVCGVGNWQFIED